MQLHESKQLKICYTYFKINPCPNFIFQSLQALLVFVLFHFTLIIVQWCFLLVLLSCYIWDSGSRVWLRNWYHSLTNNLGWKLASFIYLSIYHSYVTSNQWLFPKLLSYLSSFSYPHCHFLRLCLTQYPVQRQSINTEWAR